MLEGLGKALKKTTDKLANAIFLDKNLIDSIIRDLQRALIQADVNILLVKQLSDKIKKAALDERIKEIDKKEHVIKLLHDELLKILGEKKDLKLQEKQNRIMLLGLYGAGKTTTIGKLGNYYAKRGKKVALIGLDVHRPGAPEQIQQIAEKNNLNYFIDLDEKDALKIWKKYESKLNQYDVVLVDTAGRHTLDKELISEIKELDKKIKPTERILIIQADIGQAAKNQSQQFKDALDISGVIITKMDSSAKAGGALTACAETQAGIYFITTGEKINDIEKFSPEKFLSRLLGMGDLESLIEKIKSITNEKSQSQLQKNLEQGKLTLNDVVEQVKSMNQLGGFDKIKGMIPGMKNIDLKETGQLEQAQDKTKKWEHIINSMTQEEKTNPELFDDKKTGNSRLNRVARGSGVNNSDIRSLLKQYKLLNDMISGGFRDMDPEKGMSQKQMQKLLKKFGKRKMMRF